MGDSMILRGDLPPLVSGWGLCDIIKVRFRVTQKNQKLEVLTQDSWHGGIKAIFRLLPRVTKNWPGLPNFLKFFWVTLNYTLLISQRLWHSPVHWLVQVHKMLKSLNLPYSYDMNHVCLQILNDNLLINFFHLGFLVYSDHHEDEWWQEAEHKLKFNH